MCGPREEASAASGTQPANVGSSVWLDELAWNSDGLMPAIAVDDASGDVLMMAWVNRDSLALTVQEGRAIYWSRSRARLWRKGEESGHVQRLIEVRTDCDSDVVILRVEQIGGLACHTGRRSCFFQRLDVEQGIWEAAEPVLKDPTEIYA